MNHGAATRNRIAQRYVDDTDAGSGAGKILLCDSSYTPLCTISLQKPSHSISGPVATMLGVPLSGNASGTGTISKFAITDSDGNWVERGIAGQPGSTGVELEVDNTSVVAGQPVIITGKTYTSPL